MECLFRFLVSVSSFNHDYAQNSAVNLAWFLVIEKIQMIFRLLITLFLGFNLYCADLNIIAQSYNKDGPFIAGQNLTKLKPGLHFLENNNDISESLVDHLNTKFINDTKSDSSLINYLSFVKRTEENRKKNTISLNYETRLEEKKQSDSQNNSLNTSLKITEIFPIEQEDLKKKIKNDLYLRESVKLFVEMIGYKNS